MDITYVTPAKQALLLLYSFLLGITLGIVCGFIRCPFVIFERLCNKRGARFLTYLISDIIIAVIFTLSVIIFIYAANNGVIRYFMILSAISGVLLYRFSIYRYIYKLYILTANIIHKLCLIMNNMLIRLSEPVKKAVNDVKVKNYTVRLIKNAPRRL